MVIIAIDAPNPAALRILTQLGAESQIVGIDKKSWDSRDTMLPFLVAPKLANLPVLGDRKEPNLEAILSTSPDIIITNTSSEKADSLQSALGIPVVCIISEPDEDYEIIRLIGQICNRTDEATELIQFLENKSNELRQITEKIPESKRKRAYLSLFTNSGKFTQTMPLYQSLKIAGGINVAEQVKATTSWGSVEINKENILLWDPDIIFIDWPETSSYLKKEQFIHDKDFALLSATINNQIFYTQTSHNGKDYASALAEAFYMASRLYPDVITTEDAIEQAELVFRRVYRIEKYYRSWAEQYDILGCP